MDRTNSTRTSTKPARAPKPPTKPATTSKAAHPSDGERELVAMNLQEASDSDPEFQAANERMIRILRADGPFDAEGYEAATSILMGHADTSDTPAFDSDLERCLNGRLEALEEVAYTANKLQIWRPSGDIAPDIGGAEYLEACEAAFHILQALSDIGRGLSCNIAAAFEARAWMRAATQNDNGRRT
jgi:hypothetical protein